MNTWSDAIIKPLHECKNMIIILFNSTTRYACQFNCHLTEENILMRQRLEGTEKTKRDHHILYRIYKVETYFYFGKLST